MENKLVTCSLCKEKLFYYGNFSNYDFYTPSSKIYYCKNCDFFQKKIDDNLCKNINVNYYQKYTDKELLNRSEIRKILDLPRSLHYIDIISKFINLENISLAVDIGGAEGLFSNVLNNKFNNIKAINIEPDPKAIKVGKKLYPNISHHLATGEEFFNNLKSKNKIDLVTYFGGIYRSSEPLQLVKKISISMSHNSLALFTLPFSINNPSSQAGQNYKSMGDVFGNDTMSFFNEEILQNLLKNFFELVEVLILRNKPFYKDIPFIIAKKPKQIQKKMIIPKSINNKNMNFINSFYSKKTEANLKNIVNEKSIIHFFGSPEISNFLKLFCSNSNLEFYDFSSIYEISKKLQMEHINNIFDKDEKNIFVFDKLSTSSIANFEQVCKRLNLYKMKPCFILSDGESLDDLLLVYSSSLILKKALEIKKYSG